MSWHHAPAHHFECGNTFFVTGATYRKQPFFEHARDSLQERLFALAEQHECSLQSWCLLANHYHLVVRAPGTNVRRLLSRFHSESAIEMNARDRTPGRRVWFQYWDKTLTFEASWLARLRYANENAVHHGLVRDARNYRWCSASWFERTAPVSFVRTVQRMKIDSLKVYDEFGSQSGG